MNKIIIWVLKLFGVRVYKANVIEIDITKASRQRNWTKMEINYLKENIGKISYRSIGIELGRSKSSIVNKAKRLGLSPLEK